MEKKSKKDMTPEEIVAAKEKELKLIRRTTALQIQIDTVKEKAAARKEDAHRKILYGAKLLADESPEALVLLKKYSDQLKKEHDEAERKKQAKKATAKKDGLEIKKP
jgi:hypothetical protein